MGPFGTGSGRAIRALGLVPGQCLVLFGGVEGAPALTLKRSARHRRTAELQSHVLGNYSH